MLKHYAQNYDSWKTKYNWKNCRTGREEYGKFLLSILTAEKDGFVLNLNGAWGTGKTEFLRRLYVELAEQEYPVVYINAWESDFLKDPLVVVCTEILEQISFIFDNTVSNENEGLNEKVKESFTKIKRHFQTLLALGQPIVKTYGIISGNSEIVAVAEAAHSINQNVNSSINPKAQGVSEVNLDLIERIQGNQNELVNAMQGIRKQISFMSDLLVEVHGLKAPIVFLVDELDRCRPDYAINMLEIIKHFFDVKGCAFLIATDTASLEKSIKAIYGAEFESANYLRRFFHQRIKLPKPSIQDFIKSKNIPFQGYIDKGLKLFPFNDVEKLEHVVACTLNRNKIELRDIEQILNKLIACLNYAQLHEGVHIINIAVLLYGIVEHHFDEGCFESRGHHSQEQFPSWGTKVFGNIEFNVFIKFQFDTVKIQKSKNEYNFKSGHRQYHGYTETLAISANDSNQFNKEPWNRFNFFNDFKLQYETWKTSPEDYRLWEFYKGLIDLTSHIE